MAEENQKDYSKMFQHEKERAEKKALKEQGILDSEDISSSSDSITSKPEEQYDEGIVVEVEKRQAMKPMELNFCQEISNTLGSDDSIGIAEQINSEDLLQMVENNFTSIPNDAYILVSGKDINKILGETRCQRLVCYHAMEMKGFSQFPETWQRISPFNLQDTEYQIFEEFCKKKIFQVSKLKLDAKHLDLIQMMQRLENDELWAINKEHLVEMLKKLKQNRPDTIEIIKNEIASHSHCQITFISETLQKIYRQIFGDFLKILYPIGWEPTSFAKEEEGKEKKEEGASSSTESEEAKNQRFAKVKTWLQELNLGRLYQNFFKHGYDWDAILLGLDEEDYSEMEIPAGDKKKFLKYFEKHPNFGK